MTFSPARNARNARNARLQRSENHCLAAIARAAIALTIVATSIQASAGTLRIIPTGSNIPTYVDTSTIARQGRSVELVYVIDFRAGNTIAHEEPCFHSEATRALFDCKNNTYAVRAVSSFSDRAAGGSRTSSETIAGDDARPQPIERKTTLDYVAKYACSRK